MSGSYIIVLLLLQFIIIQVFWSDSQIITDNFV